MIGVAQYAEEAGLKITGRRLDETVQDVLFRWQGQPVHTRLPLIGALLWPWIFVTLRKVRRHFKVN